MTTPGVSSPPAASLGNSCRTPLGVLLYSPVSMPGIRVFLDLVRFEHTVFALPFAYAGMFLAADGSPTWSQFLWITVAMTAARTAAMSLNRYADRILDSRNPRTAKRPIQQGLIGAGQVLGWSLVSLFVLGFAAYQLNPLAFMLWPGALLFLVGYSYTKRFTWLSHYVLGVTDALAPMGAWVAITGTIVTRADLPAWFLSLGVMFWIAGFDMLYSLQDLEVDRRQGLFSIPARFGVRGAFATARASHVLAAVLFAFTGWSAALGVFYWIGILAVGCLLWYEHSLVKPDDLSQIGRAFFNVNSYISLTLFAAILTGIYF